MKEIVKNHGQNCYIPTCKICFIKSNKYFTTRDYSEKFRDFIRVENYRSGVMTSARIQPIVKKMSHQPRLL